MKRILKKLRTLYKKALKDSIENGDCVGLCYVADTLEYDDCMRFRQYLNRYIKEKQQTVFYTCKDNETDYTSQFIWKSKDFQARLDWLDAQIELKTRVKN